MRDTEAVGTSVYLMPAGVASVEHAEEGRQLCVNIFWHFIAVQLIT